MPTRQGWTVAAGAVAALVIGRVFAIVELFVVGAALGLAVGIAVLAVRFRRPQLAIVIDAGTEYVELHGVEISGTAEVVGEIPRMCSPDDELARPELLFARKYFGADTFFPDGKHAWLRVTPEKLTSWDFRKLYPPSAND